MTDINYINSSNVTNYVQMLEYANRVSEGWFGVGIILSFFIIIFVASMAYGAKRAFVSSAFLTIILALLLRIMNVINNYIFIFASVVFFIAMILMWQKDD